MFESVQYNPVGNVICHHSLESPSYHACHEANSLPHFVELSHVTCTGQ